MILTIKNQVAGTRVYLGGLVIVGENSQATISRDLNVLLVQDAQFLADLGSNGTVKIVLNNQVKDLNPGEALELAKVLANFSANPLATMPIYYSAPIMIKQSRDTESNSTVWSMRNDANSVRQVCIERIYLNGIFDNATPLVSTTLCYDLRRFNTATPTGGAAVTAIKMSNVGPPTAVTDIRVLDTGLTVTSVVFETPFSYIPIPDQRGSSVIYRRDVVPIKLAPGEGLCIRLTVASVAGQNLIGEITWSER